MLSSWALVALLAGLAAAQQPGEGASRHHTRGATPDETVFSPTTSTVFVVNEASVAQNVFTVNKVIPIVVGGASLAFLPNMVRAQVGDVLQFQFAARNHTVTSSLEDEPCAPNDDDVSSADGGGSAANRDDQFVNSGFVPFANESRTVGTFNVVVASQRPMFFYCAQARHCQQGMVMAVNVDSSEQLIEYANRAASMDSNIAAQAVIGGVHGHLPSQVAAFQP